MSRQRRQLPAGWRAWLLAVALGLRLGLAWAQVPDPRLGRLVRPTPGTRPLGGILAELSRQSRVPFSYSSSLVPVGQRCQLQPGPARPLGAVLRELLKTEHLAGGLLAGQLVLWPDRVAAPQGVVMLTDAVVAQPAKKKSATSQSLVIAMPPPTELAVPIKKKPLLSQTASQAPVRSESLPPLVFTPQKKRPPASSRPAYSATPASTPTYLHPTKPSGSLELGAAPPRLSPLVKRAYSRRVDNNNKTISSINRAGRSSAHGAGRTGVPTPVLLSPIAARMAHSRGASRRPPSQRREAVALLLPLPIVPTAAAMQPANLPAGWLVARPLLRPDRPAKQGQLGNPPDPKPAAFAASLRGFYLHGEAWGSESLPVGAAVKLGIPRIYLVVGVAAGPADHQSGWAWGAGLGTVGKPRGRFTPSLDLVHWVLTGEREMNANQGRLTQLRPALAWQLKRGSRWQLIGGPTLNLATAHRDGLRTRWALGQDQWLWLDSANGPTNTRLWPGVQLGVRF